MAGTLQPLADQFKIVNADGTPTPYFIKWAQQRQIDISGGVSLEQMQLYVAEQLGTHQVIAGDGLSGGGTLISDPEIYMPDSGVTPGSYTNTNLTVDEKGRITAAANGSGGGGGSFPFYDMSAGVPGLGGATEVGNTSLFDWFYNGTAVQAVRFTGGGDTAELGGWVIPRPAGAWEYAFLVSPNNFNSRYYGDAIGLRNTANGRVLTMVQFHGIYNSIEFMDWNDLTSRSGVWATISGGTANASGPYWIHMAWDGVATLTWYMSWDGFNKVKVNTAGLTGWVGSAADQIFFGTFVGVDSPGNPGAVGASSTYWCVDPNSASRILGV